MGAAAGGDALLGQSIGAAGGGDALAGQSIGAAEGGDALFAFGSAPAPLFYFCASKKMEATNGDIEA